MVISIRSNVFIVLPEGPIIANLKSLIRVAKTLKRIARITC